MNRATDSFGTASVSHQYSFLFYPRIQRSFYLLRVYQSLEFYRPPFSLSVSLDGSVAVDSVGEGNAKPKCPSLCIASRSARHRGLSLGAAPLPLGEHGVCQVPPLQDSGVFLVEWYPAQRSSGTLEEKGSLKENF